MTGQDEPGTRRCLTNTERFETVVVGSGQTGLTVAYHLARCNQSFVILEANERIGDSWRQRWDSRRLFTPACYDGLPGWPFPAATWSFSTREEMAAGAPATPCCFPPCADGEFADRPQGQSRVLSRGGPLIRVKRRDLFAAGTERVPRVVGVMDGLPMLADHRVLKVSNVIWCTGFHPDFSWIDLPGFGRRDPWQHRGPIPDQPGLYFVGLLFSLRDVVDDDSWRRAWCRIRRQLDRVSDGRSS